jgi:tripartite-type tricarboxylate transporter receptor subunit TctC
MMNRRRALLLPASLVPPAMAAPASAQPAAPYPSRPVTIVVGFPPGGLSDALTRALGQRMGQELGQTVVVDNRPGAGTSVANGFVAQSRPDGYTLLMGSNSLATNPTALPHLPPRDPERELAPVGLAYMSPFLLVVRADFLARNLEEFIAHARANPGRVDFASSGVGAVNHLALELMNRSAGIALEHIPYRGGAPALLDLRAGRVAAFFATLNDAGAQLQDGSLRALATTSARRLDQLPEVPAIAEVLPGYEAVFWQGLFAPAGTPEPILRRLSGALRAATGDPALRASLGARGVELLQGGPEALRDYLRREIETWRRVIREANIRLE